MNGTYIKIFLFAAVLLISGCGKTNFSASDGSSFKAGDVEEGDSTGEIVQEGEEVDDPADLPEADGTCKGNKILICHVPPGNPANAHELCLPEPAIPAHLEHVAATGEKDALGACL